MADDNKKKLANPLADPNLISIEKEGVEIKGNVEIRSATTKRDIKK